MITFVDELNILGDSSAAKNLNSDEEGRTMMFFDMGNPSGANNVLVYSKYMLVKKGDKVIANIPKGEKEEPRNIWAHSSIQGFKGFILIIEFEDGKIKAYKINEEKKTYESYWDLAVSEFKDIKGGDNKKAETVDYKEEEDII